MIFFLAKHHHRSEEEELFWGGGSNRQKHMRMTQFREGQFLVWPNWGWVSHCEFHPFFSSSSSNLRALFSLRRGRRHHMEGGVVVDLKKNDPKTSRLREEKQSICLERKFWMNFLTQSSWYGGSTLETHIRRYLPQTPKRVRYNAEKLLHGWNWRPR